MKYSYHKSLLDLDYWNISYDFAVGWLPLWLAALAILGEQFGSDSTCKANSFDIDRSLNREIHISERAVRHERINLTRVGRGQHCRICRARERTRGWPVDRSFRSSRWKEPPPLPLIQPLIARRPTISLNTMMTCERKTLPNLLTRSCHPEEGFNARSPLK